MVISNAVFLAEETTIEPPYFYKFYFEWTVYFQDVTGERLSETHLKYDSPPHF